MLPNFLVLGIAKCGTTTLCNALEKHPDIFISHPKEPNYFNKAIYYKSSRIKYEALFDKSGALPFRGEGSVGYTNPNRIHFIPKRIHEAVPDCRLIFMVRHPIKRMESEWKMHLRLGNTSQNFIDSLQNDMMLYNHGLYWTILSCYLKHFKKEQILVVFMEDLNNAFDEQITRVLKHIGANTKHKLVSAQSNSAKSYRKDTGLSAFLKNILGDGIKSRVPESLKERFRGNITKEWDYNINWSPEVYAEVAKYFTEDSQALLEYCGKSSDYWDFSFPTNAMNSHDKTKP
ncbi:hypothetical protein MNBD_GAMMA06-596 [hydrothermal vent metagenome]|uniref:Sulfotransferase domain-containing protein n=1 Tax=hydrothermal vent metagenome TaxID=652676 RepID=A0A3B0XDU3_9ZZZZ